MKARLLTAVFILLLWILLDLTLPVKHDFKNFNPQETAQLETEMWRSYYEKKSAKMYFQLAKTLRQQFNAPFWRSLRIAWDGGRAAFVFKKGKNRTEYQKALPLLEHYYRAINRLNNNPFDVKKVSELELEWWIIRRERDVFSPEDWIRIIAAEAAAFYNKPVDIFQDYARLRTEAMIYRDSKDNRISEEDWSQVSGILTKAWESLYNAVQ